MLKLIFDLRKVVVSMNLALLKAILDQKITRKNGFVMFDIVMQVSTRFWGNHSKHVSPKS